MNTGACLRRGAGEAAHIVQRMHAETGGAEQSTMEVRTPDPARPECVHIQQFSLVIEDAVRISRSSRRLSKRSGRCAKVTSPSHPIEASMPWRTQRSRTRATDCFMMA